MLHALYFKRANHGSWTVIYNNRYVETETYHLEKQRNKPSFIPAIEGDPPAVLSAYLLNWVSLLLNLFYHINEINSVAQSLWKSSMPIQPKWLTSKKLTVSCEEREKHKFT